MRSCWSDRWPSSGSDISELLIYTQRPDATYVAGYRAWQRLGRPVRKGENAIAILAPCVYRTKVTDEDGEERELKSLRGFKVAHVFYIAQTDGEPIEDQLPSRIGRLVLLAGDRSPLSEPVGDSHRLSLKGPMVR